MRKRENRVVGRLMTGDCSTNSGKCEFPAVLDIEQQVNRSGGDVYYRRLQLCPIHAILYAVKHLPAGERAKAIALLFPGLMLGSSVKPTKKESLPT